MKAGTGTYRLFLLFWLASSSAVSMDDCRYGEVSGGPLQGSPYEKFNTRVPLLSEVRTLPDGAEPAGVVRARIAQALEGFTFPKGEPQIVLDVESGTLAVEVAGLNRASAGRIASRLNGDPLIHEALGALARRGTRRVRVGVPVAEDGHVRLDALKAEFLPGGPPAKAGKTFRNGKPYTEYRYESGVENTREFRDLVEQSVEVIYMPKGPWGHLAVRVGTRYFSYGQVGRFVNREFLPFPGSKGFGFKVPPDKIREVLEVMDRVTENGTRHNVPPYDVYALELELIRTPTGLRYKSDTPADMKSGDAIIRNNEPVDAKLVEDGGKTFLETPTGFRYPVQERDGRMYVEPMNCIHAVRVVLAKFGLTLGLETRFPTTVTESVERIMTPGNTGGETPDFVVDYSGVTTGK